MIDGSIQWKCHLYEQYYQLEEITLEPELIWISIVWKLRYKQTYTHYLLATLGLQVPNSNLQNLNMICEYDRILFE